MARGRLCGWLVALVNIAVFAGVMYWAVVSESRVLGDYHVLAAIMLGLGLVDVIYVLVRKKNNCRGGFYFGGWCNFGDCRGAFARCKV